MPRHFSRTQFGGSHSLGIRPGRLSVAFRHRRNGSTAPAPKFILHVTPVDPRVLPGRSFENLDFYFYQRGVRFDGKCVAAVPLPAYPIRHMRIGQWFAEADHTLWQVDIPVPLAPDAVNAYRAAYRALASEPPTHRGVFDAYLTADRGAVAKNPCTAADTQPRFILHAIPARTRDLPPDRHRAAPVSSIWISSSIGRARISTGDAWPKPRCRIIPSPVSASASSARARSRFGLQNFLRDRKRGRRLRDGPARCAGAAVRLRCPAPLPAESGRAGTVI